MNAGAPLRLRGAHPRERAAGFARALTAFALAACVTHAAEEPSAAIEQRIKAAFLSKFAAYVEWPAGAFSPPDAPLVIGVLGASSVADELERAVASRTVAGHRMTVHRIGPDEDPDDCCQILFFGADTSRTRAAELLTHTRGRPVLTVTEAEQQPSESVINFLVVDNHVRFDISRPAAERNGLQLRAQLLAVAHQATAR